MVKDIAEHNGLIKIAETNFDLTAVEKLYPDIAVRNAKETSIEGGMLPFRSPVVGFYNQNAGETCILNLSFRTRVHILL